tara:strand:+ start:388 stop:1113 length:726 start_codon:yes stop_codon:yes gene_type:complete
MINQEKWIGSLSIKNTRFSNIKNQLDHDRWINTIPKKNTHSSMHKYSLIVILFVCGLLFVSAVKNETRILQKEINNLETSINIIKYNLDQAIIDNEVITSPENISLLAKEYLNVNLVSYKRSQIKQLSDEVEKLNKINKTKKEKINKGKVKNLPANIKLKVAKRIEEKKTEIRKLQALYSNPKLIPDEIKTQVANQIEEKKTELKNIYRSPKNVVTLEKVGKWSAVQVVKAFLGMPIIPGR